MKVSVIGAGHVGLVSGLCLAEKGHQVVCFDIDEEKVELINAGRLPIYEEELDRLLQNNLFRRFHATTYCEEAVRETEISLLTVGTPFQDEGIDLSQIERAAEAVGRSLRADEVYHAVVVKSTVIPGTTDGLVRDVLEKASGQKAGADFGLGMNPEFLKEGEAVADFMHPDRIVMGGIDARTHEFLDTLYAPFEQADKVHTNNQTAEMIKYASNSLLATLISFSNEIGNFCAALDDVDVVDVMRGVHLDERFSPIQEDGTRVRPGFLSYLAAGCGFGGSCFPKDVKALIAHGDEAGLSTRVLNAVIETNERQPYRMLQLLEKHFSSLKDVSIGVLGLAFKPGTDDIRGSPAIPIVQELQKRSARVRMYDPAALDNAYQWFGEAQGLTYCRDMVAAIEDCRAVLIFTRWSEFEKLPTVLANREAQPIVVDGRRMLDPQSVVHYEGIGR